MGGLDDRPPPKGHPKTRRIRKRDMLYDEPRRTTSDQTLVVGEVTMAGVLVYTGPCYIPGGRHAIGNSPTDQISRIKRRTGGGTIGLVVTSG